MGDLGFQFRATIAPGWDGEDDQCAVSTRDGICEDHTVDFDLGPVLIMIVVTGRKQAWQQQRCEVCCGIPQRAHCQSSFPALPDT